MATKKYTISDKKPSEMFVNSLRGGGSHYMVCGNCGREHYCPDSLSIDHCNEDNDDDYYKNYLQNALNH